MVILYSIIQIRWAISYQIPTFKGLRYAQDTFLSIMGKIDANLMKMVQIYWTCNYSIEFILTCLEIKTK